MSENNQNIKQNKTTKSKNKSKSKSISYKKRSTSKKTLESKVNDVLLYEKIDAKKINEMKNSLKISIKEKCLAKGREREKREGRVINKIQKADMRWGIWRQGFQGLGIEGTQRKTAAKGTLGE